MSQHSVHTHAGVRFLIISDTHGKDIWLERNQTPPKVDVVLHCGDVSQIGGLSEYRTTMDMLRKIDAELKLVIAGNHDLSLDKRWWWRGDNLDAEDDPETYKHTRALWTGKTADDAGIVFLDEGHYKFTLKSGAFFSIYPSPYTPAFGNWAFSYGPRKDRFSGAMASNPILTNGIDILMTHGPAYGRLDLTSRDERAGCGKLAEAVQRCRPKLHCFGHVHEGYGARLVNWAAGNGAEDTACAYENRDGISWIDGNDVIEREQSLIVNAAMLDDEDGCTRAP